MNIPPLQKHFHLFSESSSVLNRKANSYLPRFNYAACELWLCTELCHIINFEGLNLHTDSNGEVFIYNEDCKRDLTLYSDGHSSPPQKLLHIEAKVIYPTSGCKNDIQNLCNKLNKSRNSAYMQEGWVYLVWTENHNIRPDRFFNDRIDKLKQTIESNKATLEDGNNLTSVCSDVHEICDGNICWRGSKKRIIVKAIAFSFESNVTACAEKVIYEDESALGTLATVE